MALAASENTGRSWSSGVTFMLAAVGAAVGLGNIWKFPYVAVVVFGFLAWLIGLATIFSFNIWKDITPLGMFDVFSDKTVFDLIDYFTANVMMPIGTILIALFVGWRMKPELIDSELSFSGTLMFNTWLWALRVVLPIAILAILISGLS